MTSTDLIASSGDAPVTFASLNLSAPVQRAIDEIGWETPTPVQAEALGPARDGKDLIVQSRTGTGKTAAFGLPLVDGRVSDTPGVQALILAPTRELALQSSREIGRLGKYCGVSTTAIYGGAPMEKQVRELEAGAQIVSGTPGRVLDHLRRGTLNPEGLKVLVLDEADEMLSMGFAKELHAIMELLPEKRQTLLFSATVDGPVQRMGERHMTDPVHLELSGDAVGALGVTHYVYMVTGGGREKDLTRIIEVEDPESAIVFCNTKKETEQAAAYLQQAGFSADWLNGDLPQSEREKVMRRTREGKLRFLVATDVAARGIDISHVTHVINFALPEHLEQYIHRTGRTGRAGRTGTALSLVAPQELGTLYYLRLQYKIFPIERSLPSKGEEQTRREMDRVEMLAAAVKAKRPSAIDLAVAKRLLSHADAEGLLAGLVGSFFGASSDDVDETAAAARRERAPEPAAEEAPKAEAGGKKKRKPRRKRERSSERAPKAEAREPNGAPSEVPVAPEPVAPATEANAPETAEAAPAEPTSAGSDAGDANAERDDRSARRRRDEEEGFTRLYVNLGRRDNIRVGDLNEMFQEDGGLTREEVGRIRLRDKHSFVSVPEDKVEAVIEALRDIEVDGREVKIEVARN